MILMTDHFVSIIDSSDNQIFSWLILSKILSIDNRCFDNEEFKKFIFDNR